MGPQSRKQLNWAEGLENEVVGTTVQGSDGIGLISARSYHDDNYVRKALADLTADNQSVGVRQTKVEQHQMWLAMIEQPTGLSPRLGPTDLVPLPREHPHQRRTQGRVILDDQDARRNRVHKRRLVTGQRRRSVGSTSRSISAAGMG